MSANENLLSPVMSATENPRLEFRDGQFLLAMRMEAGGHVERFLSHAAVREAFSGIPIDSGWLPPGIVRWGNGKIGEWAVLFIPPQSYELELTTEALGEEGSLTAVALGVDRVETRLPGIVLFGIKNQYFVWSVKTETLRPEYEIYRCPLPNVEADGKICWGNLKPPTATARTMHEAWKLFITSTFNNHRANGKSKSQREDVRLVLRNSFAEGYPVSDLVRQVQHTGVTLDTAIRQFFQTGEMPQ